MSTTQVRSLAAQVGREMRTQGVTVDLAPVLDVDARPGPSSTNPDGKRSFSGNASVATRYGLAFVADGCTDWEIGERLGLAETTVISHVQSARRKLGARTRSQAVALALLGGLI